MESQKICILMGHFCGKYLMFDLKKYREAVSWKMDFGFKNDIRNFVFLVFLWEYYEIFKNSFL